MATTPGNPSCLVSGHRMPCFAECRNGEGRGKSERGARWWLEKDLVLGGDTGVFVSVTSALANILES